jgi:hypothetical protein
VENVSRDRLLVMMCAKTAPMMIVPPAQVVGTRFLPSGHVGEPVLAQRQGPSDPRFVDDRDGGADPGAALPMSLNSSGFTVDFPGCQTTIQRYGSWVAATTSKGH